jgi:hypothetical protein
MRWTGQVGPIVTTPSIPLSPDGSGVEVAEAGGVRVAPMGIGVSVEGIDVGVRCEGVGDGEGVYAHVATAPPGGFEHDRIGVGGIESFE